MMATVRSGFMDSPSEQIEQSARNKGGKDSASPMHPTRATLAILMSLLRAACLTIADRYFQSGDPLGDRAH